MDPVFKKEVRQVRGREVSYEGTWARTSRSKTLIIHGLGKMQWGADKLYKGYFKNGCPHGLGVMEFRNGSTFSGNFQKGQINGFGYLKKGNIIYKGNFVDGTAPKLDKVELIDQDMSAAFCKINDDFDLYRIGCGSVSRMAEKTNAKIARMLID